MKILARIHSPPRVRIGESAYSDLIQICPDGNYYDRAFLCTLPMDDPRVPKILERLRQAGFSPRKDKSSRMNRSKEFLMSLMREYSATDFGKCKLLELAPKNKFPDEFPGKFRDEKTGFIQLEIGPLGRNRDRDVALASSARYIVTDKMRSLLLKSDLQHLAFKPTILINTKRRIDDEVIVKNWQDWGTPWWELASDFSLPPVSPAMDIRGTYGELNVNRGDANLKYVRTEGLYSHAELHYRASDLESLKPFDLACTYERFGGEMRWKERTLVASKRFYDFCVQHGLKAEWVPVRIDPD